ncbi:MAG: hypothetical protein IPP74_07960 [Alphaproteobacteria bacterium]|nr:hypothetical protein [Alphaproteobacteria bacterium]
MSLQTRYLIHSTLTLLLLGACSVAEPTPLNLRPVIKPSVSNSNVGQGQKIGVSVSDDRPNKKVGDYGPNESLRADVTVEDLTAPLLDVVNQGLKSKGFDPVPTSFSHNKTLHIRIVSLQLNSSTARMDSSLDLQATVSAEATNGNANMSKVFHAEEKSQAQLLSEKKRNHIQADSILSDALTKVLEDHELATFLAR